ncbi:2Fe-2S iron-sulfur cluster-binding protein [Salinadaptatus halalkaliphilus]|uniref:2Fe-2S iron-sulfur cluster-binding protein n=1 Tax=Salinadaptatus halalkaliphilus TaxID=2419781 RepID=UPI001FEA05EF|nr:2Fe-2S iron-sulfur cluster-binding protein [Salinadaptatus halalkaliphilus]
MTACRLRFDDDRRRILAGIGESILFAGCLDDADADDPDEVTTFEVGVPEQDETVAAADDEAILSPALDAGVDIPYACEAGTCGECTARYDGDATELVTHDGNEYLEDDQRTDGWVLTRVTFPEDDFDPEISQPDDE